MSMSMNRVILDRVGKCINCVILDRAVKCINWVIIDRAGKCKFMSVNRVTLDT